MAKILVVDDNDLVRASMRAILQAGGYEAQEVGDARAAIEAVKSVAPDLVLTDLMMPGTPGVDLIRELRRTGYDGAIIAVSGGGGETGPGEMLEMATRLGADAYVSKPFHRADLLAKVAALLERRGRA